MGTPSVAALRRIVSRFRRIRVLVVGDLILDEFIWGDVSRISPEAPVPVVWVRNESYMPGGAANVAHNLAALGAAVSLIGLVGDDLHGSTLRHKLAEKGVDTGGVIVDHSRPTTLKTRVVAHHQQLVRIDREKIAPVAGRVLARMVEYLEAAVDSVDAVIIEDYGKGVITPRLLKRILPLLRTHGKIIAVDPKEEHFRYYRGISVITPNHHEASRLVGFPIRDGATLEKAGEKILRLLDCSIALITLGEHGMAVFEKGKKVQQIPTVAQEVFDVSGAGDTVVAAYTLALAAGANAVEAALIANHAAGLVVGKVGIAVVTPQELLQRITSAP
ncbi:MAG: D-glycero-beta-D-manno-heptose-7-phosphate kinase [Acidobacteriota bacterium]